MDFGRDSNVQSSIKYLRVLSESKKSEQGTNFHLFSTILHYPTCNDYIVKYILRCNHTRCVLYIWKRNNFPPFGVFCTHFIDFSVRIQDFHLYVCMCVCVRLSVNVWWGCARMCVCVFVLVLVQWTFLDFHSLCDTYIPNPLIFYSMQSKITPL